MSENSITQYLMKLYGGDPLASQAIWEAYFGRLVGVARRMLEGRVRLGRDEEDVALSALRSFYCGVAKNQYSKLNDRNDLWNLLVAITCRKSLHLLRDEGRKKRGGGLKISGNHECSMDDDLLQQIASTDPSPDAVAQFIEEIDRLLASLGSPELVELSLLKMEGHTNAEIAHRWQKSERTVERKLNLIRKIWEQKLE